MKNTFIASIVLFTLFLSSCISDDVGPAGPQGPQGPQGDQGPKGDSGYVFEFEDINFTDPDYEVYLPFPDDFETLSSDVALVYLLWDVVDVDGQDIEVWRPLPQALFTDDGMLQYNFDFTTLDVRLFMSADFDLGQLGAIDTDDWIARVVIVPGDFWSDSRLQSSELSYEYLEEALGLPALATPTTKHSRRK